MICPQCGNDTFNNGSCSTCGYSISSGNGGFNVNGFKGFGDDSHFPDDEVNNGKVLAILGYIFGFLFFLPLVIGGKKTSYGLYHANNAFVLFIANLIINSLSRFLPFTAAKAVFSLLDLAIIVLAILGIVFAATGAKKKIPIIGEINILK